MNDAQFLERFTQIVLDSISDGSYEFQNVCNQAFLSRSQLYRRIKRISGLSTTLFIRKIRLQKAKAILNSDTNIKMNQLAV